MCEVLLLLLTACDGGETGDKTPDTADSVAGVDSVVDSAVDSGGSDTGDTADSDIGDTADSDTGEDSRPPMDTDRETVEIAIDDAPVKLTAEPVGTLSARIAASGAGDLDDDGRADIVVGLPWKADAGYTYIESGATLVPGSLNDANATLTGASRTCVGMSVAAAGDLNRDGFGDLVVGDPCWAADWGDPGRAFVFSGPLTGMQDAEMAATAILIGEFADGEAPTDSATGASVAGLGDYTGDGVDDIAVGAETYDLYGAAYVVAGPIVGDLDLGTQSTLRVVGGAGNGNVAAVGDTDGDGFADMAFGSGGGTECVHVFNGPASGDLLPDDAGAIFACVSDDVAGIAPAGAGDVDQDGYADILVDAVAHDEGDVDGGAVYLFLGPLDAIEDTATADATYLGTTKGNVGSSVASAGDPNGDGFDDVLIGAPNNGSVPSPGLAYLVLSPVYGTFALDGADVIIRGSDADEVGSTVAPAGDVDGDGLGDLLIAGEGDADGGEDAGAVWVLYAASLW